MTVGKAIFYLLNNYTNLTDIVGTRIYPEVAEQDGATPFVVYTIISNSPSDTHSGPSQLDVAQVDVVAYSTSYAECIDIGVHVRAALDRVTGTYNGVNVQSCQYTTELIDFDDYRRSYVITQSYDVRISRTAFDIAQGTPVTGALLGDLQDVTITDVLEHDALIYDSNTAQWVNGIPTDIPVINKTVTDFPAGTPLRADGVQGDRVKINVWRPTNDPKLFIGLAADDIAADDIGHARQIGNIHHVNTDAFEIGDILYPQTTLSLGMSALGTTVPEAPNAAIPCAIVLRKQENTGRLFVRTWTPGIKLAELVDVYSNAPTNGQSLTWNTANNRWQPGVVTPRSLSEIDDVQDYDPTLLANRTMLRWDSAAKQWALIPQDSLLPTAYYLGAYDTEAGTGRTAASTASITVERYLTIQGDGEGESISAQSDTPSSGNKIVRKIWYKANSFEQTDVDTWTLVHTFADDTAYASTTATFEALLNAQTYGTPPFTLAQSWQDVPAFTGLLDTYSGASAAYSLRLLDSTYTGYAINVRRASDNAVQDIGFDSNNELDTTALATFCAGTDGYVVRWYDQSGNGNDAVQATTANQPKVYDSSTGVITESGKPALKFDGSDDGLNCSTDLRATTGASTVIMARNIDMKANVLQNVFSFYKTQRHLIENSLAPNYEEVSISTNETSGEYIKFPSTDLTGRHLFISIWDGTTQNGSVDDVELYYNGTVQSQTIGIAAFGTTASGTNSIGYKHDTNSQFCDGTIQEVIVYLSDQSSNRAGIETNINDYYSIY